MKSILTILFVLIAFTGYSQFDTLMFKRGYTKDSSSFLSAYRTAINKNTDSIAALRGGINSKQDSFTSKAMNLVYASPLPDSSGNINKPSFRALDNTDIPYRTQYKIPLAATTVYAFGDSYTLSTQATSTAYGYINIFGKTNNVTISNQAVTSVGAYQAAINGITNIPTGSTSEVTMLFGFNDLRRNGSATSTLNKINCGIGVLAATSWLQTAVAASAVTNTGSWSNYTTITSRSAQKLSGNARSSTTSGNTLSYTTTVASTNIVIGTYGSDGITLDYGRFTVSVDGTVVATYNPNGFTDGVSDGVNANTVIPNIVFIDGLSNQTHAIIITLLDNKVTPIDYIGILRSPNDCQGVLVGSIPRMNLTGYATAPASSSNAVVDAAKISMRNYCDTVFKNGRSLSFIDLDKYFFPSTCIGADNIHPNDFGYQQIYYAFQSGVTTSVPYKANMYTFQSNTASAVNSYIAGYTGGSSNDFLLMAINRNPITGVFQNTGRAASQISLTSLSGDAGIEFNVSPTSNTLPVMSAKLDKNSNFLLGQNSATPITPTTLTNSLAIATGTANTAGYAGVSLSSTLRATTANTNSLVLTTGQSTSFTQHIFGDRVGIGTILPVGQFNVVDSAASATRGIWIMENNTSSTGAYLDLQKSRGTPNAPTAVTSGDGLGLIDVRGYVGATNGYVVGSRITTNVLGTVTDIASGLTSNVTFSTRNRVGFAERWRIDTSGNFTNILAETATDALTVNGNLRLNTAGNGIEIAEGSNGKVGQAALTSGTNAITISGLTTSSRAIVTFVSVGGTVTTTWQYKAVCTANTLTITAIDNTGATNTLDTSTLNYLIIN